MTRDPVSVRPETHLLECAKKMVRKRVGSLLLVQNKKLIGFISNQDILWALIKKSKDDLSKIKAVDISPKKIATIKPTATIRDALKKMKKLKFERLPVIEDNKLVGLLTARDIFNFQPELYPELNEFSQIREEAKKLKQLKKTDKVYDGICEECGSNGMLSRFNGMLICESCKESH